MPPRQYPHPSSLFNPTVGLSANSECHLNLQPLPPQAMASQELRLRQHRDPAMAYLPADHLRRHHRTFELYLRWSLSKLKQGKDGQSGRASTTQFLTPNWMDFKVITLESQLKNEGNSHDAEERQRRGAGEEVEACEGKMGH
jgi:hypothetical protein